MRTSTDIRGTASSKMTNKPLQRENPRAIDDHGGNSDGDDAYSRFGGDVREGRPLLLDEVADYIDVDFRDGTGPAALPPNDVARAFRDAEFLSREDGASARRNFWAALSDGDDDGVGGVSSLLAGGRGAGRGRGKWEHKRRQNRRVVHVESATTGTFFKVYEKVNGKRRTRERGLHGSGGQGGGRDGHETDNGGDGGQGGSAVGGDGDPAEDEVRVAERLGVTVRELSLMRFNNATETGVMLVQGVLAGLSLSSMYTLASATDLAEFLASYEAEAGEFRRVMFLLCTVALMGTEDQLLQARAKRDEWARVSWSRRLHLRASVLLYAGCLVSTLVCAVADTTISNAAGETSTAWYDKALADPDFSRQVVLWYGFSVARFLFAWAGWILVCRRRWRASLHSDHAQMELKSQREKLTAAEQQISRLHGRHLDNLSTRDLHELAGSLKRGLENVDRLIDIRYRGEAIGAL